MQALKLIYHGEVQGVGFRYRTRRIAQKYPVAGYVKNRPDNTVELVVQGTGEAVALFLDEVKYQMSGFIVRIDSEEAALDNYSSFTIDY